MKTTMTICNQCFKFFVARVADLKRNRAKYCSRKCCGEYRSTHLKIVIVNTICAYCNKMFYRNASKKVGSKSGLYFCTRKHKDLAQKIGGIESIMPKHYGNGQHDYREIAFKHSAKKCHRCNYDSNPAAIVVHHKDRNRTNNSIDNLEILCANCHLIEHFGGERG